MKRAVMFFAVAVAVSAFGITTTKEYVDRRDATITNAVYALQTNFEQRVDNVYTKSQTDARILELAPRTSLAPATNYTDNAVEIAYHDAVDYIDRVARRILTTNDVCNIVTNEVEGTFGEWQWPSTFHGCRFGVNYEWVRTYGDRSLSYYTIEVSFFPGEMNVWDGWYNELAWEGDEYGWQPNVMQSVQVFADGNVTVLNILLQDIGTLSGTRTYTPGQNALGLARLSDIPDSVSPETVTNVVRAVAHKVSDYIYDPVDEVCWKRRMLGGYLEYVAVTNIDVTLPENYKALEALERGNE